MALRTTFSGIVGALLISALTMGCETTSAPTDDDAFEDLACHTQEDGSSFHFDVGAPYAYEPSGSGIIAKFSAGPVTTLNIRVPDGTAAGDFPDAWFDQKAEVVIETPCSDDSDRKAYVYLSGWAQSEYTDLDLDGETLAGTIAADDAMFSLEWLVDEDCYDAGGGAPAFCDEVGTFVADVTIAFALDTNAAIGAD